MVQVGEGLEPSCTSLQGLIESRIFDLSLLRFENCMMEGFSGGAELGGAGVHPMFERLVSPLQMGIALLTLKHDSHNEPNS